MSEFKRSTWRQHNWLSWQFSVLGNSTQSTWFNLQLCELQCLLCLNFHRIRSTRALQWKINFHKGTFNVSYGKCIKIIKTGTFLDLFIWSTASPVGHLVFHCKYLSRVNIKTLFSFKLTRDVMTGNKSFIMLDRWNKLSHDSSNSTIGIFTLSHHTKDICNPLQCKHMIQRHFFECWKTSRPIHQKWNKTKLLSAANTCVYN